MLKITEISRTTSTVTLKLEGRIAGCWLSEVENACRSVISTGCHLRLDMTDVTFVERSGVLFFQELPPNQVALLNCSPFLLTQLRKGDFYANNVTGS